MTSSCIDTWSYIRILESQIQAVLVNQFRDHWFNDSSKSYLMNEVVLLFFLSDWYFFSKHFFFLSHSVLSLSYSPSFIHFLFLTFLLSVCLSHSFSHFISFSLSVSSFSSSLGYSFTLSILFSHAVSLCRSLTHALTLSLSLSFPGRHVWKVSTNFQGIELISEQTWNSKVQKTRKKLTRKKFKLLVFCSTSFSDKKSNIKF